MKTIVLMINKLSIGGAERLAVDEANELYHQGFRVILITFATESSNSYMDQCILPQPSKLCIPFLSLFDIRSWYALIVLLRTLHADVVVTHLWFANTVGRVASKIVGIPTIISFEHNVYDQVKTWKQFLIDKILQKFSTHIVAVSTAVYDSLIAHGILASHIVIIENGISLDRYQNVKPSNIRSEKNIPYDQTVFLFVGRLIPQKGVDILIHAFSKLHKGFLLIAGDGINRAELEKQTSKLNIIERIFFLGVRNDVPALLKAADCLILPSRWEGQGLVVPEAFASGLPVIISNFPAGVAMVEQNINGLIVSKENSEELAKAMEKFFSKEFKEKLAKNTILSAQRFSIQRHIENLLSYVS